MSNATLHSIHGDHPSTARRRLDFGARSRNLLTKRSFRTSSPDDNEDETLSDDAGGPVWVKGRKYTKRSEGSTAKRICRSLQTHSSFTLSASSSISAATNNPNRRSDHCNLDVDLGSGRDFNECSLNSTKGCPVRPNSSLHRSSSTPLFSLSAASLQTLNERVATQETVFFNSFLTLPPPSLERANEPTQSPPGCLKGVGKDIIPATPGTADSFASFFSTSTESSTVLTPSDKLFSFQQTTSLSSARPEINRNDVMNLDLDLPDLSISSSSTHSSSWTELEAKAEPGELDEDEEDDLIVLDGSSGLEGCFGKVELMDELSIMMKRTHLPRPSFSEDDIDPGELFD